MDHIQCDKCGEIPLPHGYCPFCEPEAAALARQLAITRHQLGEVLAKCEAILAKVKEVLP